MLRQPWLWTTHTCASLLARALAGWLAGPEGQVVAHTRAAGIDAADRRRVDLLEHGFGRCVVLRCPLVSPLSREGRAQARAADCDGAALRVAEQHKLAAAPGQSPHLRSCYQGWQVLAPRPQACRGLPGPSETRAALTPADSCRRLGATMVESPPCCRPVSVGGVVDGPGPAVTEGFGASLPADGKRRARRKKGKTQMFTCDVMTML